MNFDRLKCPQSRHTSFSAKLLISNQSEHSASLQNFMTMELELIELDKTFPTCNEPYQK